MDYHESSTWLTIGLILASILVSGPMVPSIDFTSKPGESIDRAGPSEASVSIVSAPAGEFRIAEGRFGGGPFLFVPSVSVRVEAVSGDPILIYEIAVRDLGFNAAELVFLSAADAGREKTIEIDRPAVEQDSLTERSYDAGVSIRVNVGGNTRVLYQKNVTVEVEETNGN